MTPSMRLSEIQRSYTGHPDKDRILRDLAEAMHLGHEFGLQRAVDLVENYDAPGRRYLAGFATELRKLKAVEIKPVRTVDGGDLAS